MLGTRRRGLGCGDDAELRRGSPAPGSTHPSPAGSQQRRQQQRRRRLRGPRGPRRGDAGVRRSLSSPHPGLRRRRLRRAPGIAGNAARARPDPRPPPHLHPVPRAWRGRLTAPRGGSGGAAARPSAALEVPAPAGPRPAPARPRPLPRQPGSARSGLGAPGPRAPAAAPRLSCVQRSDARVCACPACDRACAGPRPGRPVRVCVLVRRSWPKCLSGSACEWTCVSVLCSLWQVGPCVHGVCG